MIYLLVSRLPGFPMIEIHGRRPPVFCKAYPLQARPMDPSTRLKQGCHVSDYASPYALHKRATRDAETCWHSEISTTPSTPKYPFDTQSPASNIKKYVHPLITATPVPHHCHHCIISPLLPHTSPVTSTPAAASLPPPLPFLRSLSSLPLAHFLEQPPAASVDLIAHHSVTAPS